MFGFSKQIFVKRFRGKWDPFQVCTWLILRDMIFDQSSWRHVSKNNKGHHFEIQWNFDFSNLHRKQKLIREIRNFEISGVKLQWKQVQGKQLLVWEIRIFEKSRIREIEVPCTVHSNSEVQISTIGYVLRCCQSYQPTVLPSVMCVANDWWISIPGYVAHLP